MFLTFKKSTSWIFFFSVCNAKENISNLRFHLLNIKIPYIQTALATSILKPWKTQVGWAFVPKPRFLPILLSNFILVYRFNLPITILFCWTWHCNNFINFNCSQIPVFVQLQQMRQKYFLGVCEGSGIRTSFDMIHLHRTFPQYNHLSGLLSLFKSKLVSYKNVF